MAPPPATTALCFKARFTIMIASCKDLSTSAITWSAPPRRISVHVLAFGHPSKTLYLSPPICTSSNLAHEPRFSGLISETVVCTEPPTACTTLSMSSAGILPAQKMPLSAKNCVARSPIGSFESTMLAPVATIASSLFMMIFHSASTISCDNTFGSVNFLGCCSKPAYENAFLKATPFTNRDSSIEPPGTFLIPIRFSSKSSLSSTNTASTAILVNSSALFWIILEDMAVRAHLSSNCLISASLWSVSNSTCNSRILSQTRSHALRNALVITCEGMPSSMNCLLSFKNSAARSVTEVVPSPTSASCDREISTRIFAAG